MADTQYLNQNEQQIDLQAAFASADKNLENYLNNKNWSPKFKRKFIQSYQALRDGGIKGATLVDEKTNTWEFDVGNSNIDPNSVATKAAAYYFQQHITNPSTTSSTETKNKNLPVFNNNEFVTGLKKFIATKQFAREDFDSLKDEWDNLDTRSTETFERGRKNRAEKLASYLKAYRDTVTEDKYSFEGSPYENLQDFQTRIDKAIESLSNPDNANESLSQLGLRAYDWLNNGLNDPTTYTNPETGEPMTYAEVAMQKKLFDAQQQAVEQKKAEEEQAVLAQQEALKVQEEQEAAAAKEAAQKAKHANAFTANRRYNFASKDIPMDAKSLKLIQKDLSEGKHLTNEQLAKVSWLFHNAGENNLYDLSQEEFDRMSPRYRRPHRLKRISNLSGIYYDPIDKKLVQPYNPVNGSQEVTAQDIINKKNPDVIADRQQDEYMNSLVGDLDNYELAGLLSVMLDSASIVDPEPVSAATLAEIGTALRAYERSKDGWSWADTGWTTLDAGIGALAAVPIAGDAALAWRISATGLKYLGYLGMIFNGLHLKGAADAAIKWANYATEGGEIHPVEAYKKLTNKEADDLKAGLLVLAGAKGLLHGKFAQKRTEPIVHNQQKVADVDVKIKGENTKIEVTPEEAKNIRTRAIGKTGLQHSNEKLRAQPSVQKYAKDNNISTKDIELVSAPGVFTNRNAGLSYRFNSSGEEVSSKNFGYLLRPFAYLRGKATTNTTEEGGLFHALFHGYKPVAAKAEVSTTAGKTTAKTTSKPAAEPAAEPTTTKPKSNVEIPTGKSVERGSIIGERAIRPEASFNSPSNKEMVPRKPGSLKAQEDADKRFLGKLSKGKFTSKDIPVKDGTYQFEDAQGNLHSWTIKTTPKNYVFTSEVNGKKVTNWISRAKGANFLRQQIYNKVISAFSPNGLRSKVSLPANVSRILQGTSYSWMKQGGTITDKQFFNYLRQYK